MGNYTYEKQENTNELIKEGDYEVVLERFEKKTLPSGKEKLSLMFRIRTDIDQEYQNRVIFDDIWTEKENPQFFNRKRVNQLLGTQKDLEDGTEFETIDNIIEYMTGSFLGVHIVIELDEYRGEDVNRVAYYRSSKVLPQKIGEIVHPKDEEEHKPPVNVSNPANNEDDDDDLPF